MKDTIWQFSEGVALTFKAISFAVERLEPKASSRSNQQVQALLQLHHNWHTDGMGLSLVFGALRPETWLDGLQLDKIEHLAKSLEYLKRPLPNSDLHSSLESESNQQLQHMNQSLARYLATRMIQGQLGQSWTGCNLPQRKQVDSTAFKCYSLYYLCNAMMMRQSIADSSWLLAAYQQFLMGVDAPIQAWMRSANELKANSLHITTELLQKPLLADVESTWAAEGQRPPWDSDQDSAFALRALMAVDVSTSREPLSHAMHFRCHVMALAWLPAAQRLELATAAWGYLQQIGTQNFYASAPAQFVWMDAKVLLAHFVGVPNLAQLLDGYLAIFDRNQQRLHPRHYMMALLRAASLAPAAETEKRLGSLLASRKLLQPATPAHPVKSFYGRLRHAQWELLGAYRSMLKASVEPCLESDELTGEPYKTLCARAKAVEKLLPPRAVGDGDPSDLVLGHTPLREQVGILLAAVWLFLGQPKRATPWLNERLKHKQPPQAHPMLEQTAKLLSIVMDLQKAAPTEPDDAKLQRAATFRTYLHANKMNDTPHKALLDAIFQAHDSRYGPAKLQAHIQKVADNLTVQYPPADHLPQLDLLGHLWGEQPQTLFPFAAWLRVYAQRKPLSLN